MAQELRRLLEPDDHGGRMTQAFEQGRVSIRATSVVDLALLLRVMQEVTEHTRHGYKLFAVELVFERPVAVAAPRGRTTLPPTRSEGSEV